MTPEQIAELRTELQTAARDYARLAAEWSHLHASTAERHADRYRRAAEALAALTTSVDATGTPGTCGTCAHYEQHGTWSCGVCRNGRSIAVDTDVTPDDGCRLGYAPKATP